MEQHNLLEGKIFSDNNFDVIGINETWLNSNSPDSLLTNGLSYNVYKKDKPSRGVGVCLFVSSTMPCYRAAIAECFYNAEILAVDISFLVKNCV